MEDKQVNKLHELTIMDVKELVEGKTVTVSSTNGSAISVHMKNAVLIADPEAGSDGKITLLEPDTGCKIDLDSDNFIESIHGNENAMVVRFSNGMGGLDIEITGKTLSLIHPITNKYARKEPVHKDFVSRYEFINRTGVFVTPEFFEYIYSMEFQKANVSADEFVDNYGKKYSICIQEVPLSGTFRYEVMDESLSCLALYDDVFEPNLWEIVNSLAVEYETERQLRWENIESYKSALQEAYGILGKMQLESKNPSKYQS